MQLIKTHSQPSSNNFILDKRQILIKNQLEKNIAISYAIFEGLGLGGIISAAFWYATAPMAPEGFKGPIATLTIAITTIASLIVAIPITLIAYNKIIKSIENFFKQFNNEAKRFEENLIEIYFELLKLRALYDNEDEFLFALKSLNQPNLVDDIAFEISHIYPKVKNKRYCTKWEKMSSLTLVSNEQTYSINSIPFIELIKDHELATSKFFRKSLVNCIFESTLHNRLEHGELSFTTKFKNMLHASLSAIMCSEVLLSIGWTVASILIGIKVITPIPIHHWLIFAIISIIIGPIFGLGVYLSNIKQCKRDLIKDDIHNKNQMLTEAREIINLIFTKKLMEQKKHIGMSLHDLGAKIFHQNPKYHSSSKA